MRMRRWVLTCVVVLLSTAAAAQDFDAARGYIFEQPFVQRIDSRTAQALLGGDEALRQFETFAWLKAPEPPLPAGVRRQGG